MPSNIAHDQNTIVDQWSSRLCRWYPYNNPHNELMYENAVNFPNWKYTGLWDINLGKDYQHLSP